MYKARKIQSMYLLVTYLSMYLVSMVFIPQDKPLKFLDQNRKLLIFIESPKTVLCIQKKLYI